MPCTMPPALCNPSVTSEATKGIIGIALVEAIAMLFPDHPDKHDAILADYADLYVQHCDKDELDLRLDSHLAPRRQNFGGCYR